MLDNRRKIRNLQLIILLIFLTLISLGCKAPIGYIHPNLINPTTSIKKIAVLPFANKTKKIDAGLIITYIFNSQLRNNTDYEIANLGDIKEILLDNLVRIKHTIDIDTARIIGDKLKVHAILIGEVLEYEEQQNENNELIPKLAISVHLLDIKTGKILWMCQHEKNGDDYKLAFDIGQETSVVRLAQKMISEMLKTLGPFSSKS